jgi:hypothetical protein
MGFNSGLKGLNGNGLLYFDAGNFLTSPAANSLLRITALYGVSQAADVNCFNAIKRDSPAARNTGSLVSVGLMANVWVQKRLWPLFLPLAT